MSRGFVLLAAGGTGGHLFPAFALAEELARRGIAVDLVTDDRGDRYGTGFPAGAVHQIPSATFAGHSPVAAAKAAGRLVSGVRRAHALLGTLKPGAVVGFGGYPTFPPILAATMRAIPTVIHEQNAVMGRANRILARRVSRIAASYEGTRRLPPGSEARVVVTGNPVRAAVIEAGKKPYRPPSAAGPLMLVAVGGSQGARVLSDLLPPALAALSQSVRRRLEVVQQARQEDLERVEAAYRQAGIAATIAAFFKDLPEIVADAQLVVARAGASTVAELAVLGRPAILIPLPHALDNDQLYNARRFEAAGGGLCLQQKGLDAATLSAAIAGLFEAPDRLSAAAAAAKCVGRPDAVARLADLVEAAAYR